MSSVTVNVAFDSQPVINESGMLVIKLEDVSILDSSSITIAQLRHPLTDQSFDNLTFQLTTDQALDSWSTYTVSAHLSLHDDVSDIRRGDYITMQSYPVLTQGNPDEVEIILKRVG